MRLGEYFAICLLRTSLPFNDLQQVMISAIRSSAAKQLETVIDHNPEVVNLRILGAAMDHTNSAHPAERLWADIIEGERILEEIKIKAPTAPAKCQHCSVFKDLLGGSG